MVWSDIHPELLRRKEERYKNIAGWLKESEDRQEAETAYYDKFRAASGIPLPNSDYEYLSKLQPIIEAADDPEAESERMMTAMLIANNMKVPVSTVYGNLDEYTRRWVGARQGSKSTLKAVADSFMVSGLSIGLNAAAIKYHTDKSEESKKALEDKAYEISLYKDSMPAPWSQNYQRQGGWLNTAGDVLRSMLVGAGENSIQMGVSIGAGALAATGVGAVGMGIGAGALGKTAAGKAVAGALTSQLAGTIVAGLATAGTTAYQTVGVEYLQLLDTLGGENDELAWNTASLSAGVQGVIEAAGGGLVSSATAKIAKNVFPGFLEHATAKWFITGRMGAAAKAAIGYAKEMVGEGFE
jgi:hypothetical protein